MIQTTVHIIVTSDLHDSMFSYVHRAWQARQNLLHQLDKEVF